MEKICIGKRQKTEKKEQNEASYSGGNWLISVGIAVMTLWLAIAAVPEKTENVKSYDDEAVAVMSMTENGSEKEELILPDKKTAAVEESSVFDVIGEFFASLIFGE